MDEGSELDTLLQFRDVGQDGDEFGEELLELFCCR